MGGLHLHHHELLSPEFAPVDPLALLAAVGPDFIAALRLRDWLRDRGVFVVAGTEGLLLFNSGSWLRANDGLARATDYRPTYPAAHATGNSGCYHSGAVHSSTRTC